ncbi:MAG: SUMF1/EgtB/PvdO family nonheme iron enzyme [Saprospiraceae bacterium]
MEVPDFAARTPITNAQYKAFVDATGQHAPRTFGYPFDHPDHPVVGISWHDAVAYCAWLSAQTEFSLPPAQLKLMRYAARGNQRNRGSLHEQPPTTRSGLRHDTNSSSTTQPVGLKLPTNLGLHDMSGNVWEWCADHWHYNYNEAPMRPWLLGDAEKTLAEWFVAGLRASMTATVSVLPQLAIRLQERQYRFFGLPGTNPFAFCALPFLRVVELFCKRTIFYFGVVAEKIKPSYLYH